MYIWAILFALLFTFGMCWVAILNQNTLPIVLPPGNLTIQAYVWEIVLASAAATAIFIGLIALLKGSARRHWEKDIELKIGDLNKKMEGLASKVEDLEIKASLPPPKIEEIAIEKETVSEG